MHDDTLHNLQSDGILQCIIRKSSNPGNTCIFGQCIPTFSQIDIHSRASLMHLLLRLYIYFYVYTKLYIYFYDRIYFIVHFYAQMIPTCIYVLENWNRTITSQEIEPVIKDLPTNASGIYSWVASVIRYPQISRHDTAHQ